mmetsp:Transcript_19335/g.48350  ORF Transcript_19335/g.48350 Transcript_19335/m.48350 type:complete len:441 (+) Transcript_19335:1049-2371(+)
MVGEPLDLGLGLQMRLVVVEQLHHLLHQAVHPRIRIQHAVEERGYVLVSPALQFFCLGHAGDVLFPAEALVRSFDLYSGTAAVIFASISVARRRPAHQVLAARGALLRHGVAAVLLVEVLVVVRLRQVPRDNRERHGDDEHTGQRREYAAESTHGRERILVPIPNRSQRHQPVPKSSSDTCECVWVEAVVVQVAAEKLALQVVARGHAVVDEVAHPPEDGPVLALLIVLLQLIPLPAGEVDVHLWAAELLEEEAAGREEDHSHEQEHEQHEQDRARLPHCRHHQPKAVGVLAHLEEPAETRQPHDPQQLQHLRLPARERHLQKKRRDRQRVRHVHRFQHELHPAHAVVEAAQKPQHVLRNEDNGASKLEAKPEALGVAQSGLGLKDKAKNGENDEHVHRKIYRPRNPRLVLHLENVVQYPGVLVEEAGFLHGALVLGTPL